MFAVHLRAEDYIKEIISHNRILFTIFIFSYVVYLLLFYVYIFLKILHIY